MDRRRFYDGRWNSCPTGHGEMGRRMEIATSELSNYLKKPLDLSEAFSETDREFLKETADKKRLLVFNKTDLPERLELPSAIHLPGVRVCCLSGQGIEELKDAINAYINAHNEDPKRFTWTAKAEAILEKCLRAKKALISSKQHESIN